MKIRRRGVDEVRGDARVDAAVHAYRLACDYQRRVHAKWLPRDAELRRLDEFHRTRCAWENTSYRAERLREYAAEALLAVVRGDEPSRVISGGMFDATNGWRCRNRYFVRALEALREVYAHAKDEVSP